jgi:hypothetical protein
MRFAAGGHLAQALAHMKLFVLLLVALSSCSCAHATPVIGEACRVAVDSTLSGWRLSKIASGVGSWSKQERFNPVVANGDFDGNGKRDQALLVETDHGIVIAVCFSGENSLTIKVIERPYCVDYVLASPANSSHYNYDTEATEKIEHDGISVRCFEKAGATYVHERGAFRKIVDSD